jgi:hypothetical protein
VAISEPIIRKVFSEEVTLKQRYKPVYTKLGRRTLLQSVKIAIANVLR